MTCRSLEFIEGAPCTAKRGTFAEFSSRGTPWGTRNLCRIFESGHPAGAPLARPCRSLEYITSAPCIARREPLANFECETVPRTGAPACEKFRKVPRNFFFPGSEPYGLRYEEERRNFLFSFSSTSTDAAVRVFFFAGYSAKFSPRARGTPPGHPSPALAAPLSV